MADKKSTVALCLPRAPHLRRFSSQAAPGKNLGESPPRVLDSFALDWNATLNRALRRAWLASSPADPKSRRSCSARWRSKVRTCAARHNLPNCLDPEEAVGAQARVQDDRGQPALTACYRAILKRPGFAPPPTLELWRLALTMESHSGGSSRRPSPAPPTNRRDPVRDATPTQVRKWGTSGHTSVGFRAH
jgi:hypothetical protein